VQATGAAYEGAVDVAAFTVAQMPSGSAAGAGRIDDSGTDDFAFDAVPVRKSPPAGGAVHVYRTGGTAIVVATDTLTSLSKSCTGGKTKVCTATVGATGAHRWSVDLTTGVEAALAGVSELTLQAADVAEPGAGADTYGATLAGADSRTAGPDVLLAGNVRVR
jgi:hypothetical protein